MGIFKRKEKKSKCVYDFMFSDNASFAYSKTHIWLKQFYTSDERIGLNIGNFSMESQKTFIHPLMGNFYPCQSIIIKAYNDDNTIEVLYEVFLTPFYREMEIKEIKCKTDKIPEDVIRKSLEERIAIDASDFSRTWRNALKQKFNNPKYVEECKKYFKFIKQEKDEKAYAECYIICDKNQSEYEAEVSSLLND